MGVTRERVRQIQGEAIDKLRGRISRRGLEKEDFL
jgi:DNA-directed RNA polymerase sigma subunit (sigma70/sigma32)